MLGVPRVALSKRLGSHFPRVIDVTGITYKGLGTRVLVRAKGGVDSLFPRKAPFGCKSVVAMWTWPTWIPLRPKRIKITSCRVFWFKGRGISWKGCEPFRVGGLAMTDVQRLGVGRRCAVGSEWEHVTCWSARMLTGREWNNAIASSPSSHVCSAATPLTAPSSLLAGDPLCPNSLCA